MLTFFMSGYYLNKRLIIDTEFDVLTNGPFECETRKFRSYFSDYRRLSDQFTVWHIKFTCKGVA